MNFLTVTKSLLVEIFLSACESSLLLGELLLLNPLIFLAL